MLRASRRIGLAGFGVGSGDFDSHLLGRGSEHDLINDAANRKVRVRKEAKSLAACVPVASTAPSSSASLTMRPISFRRRALCAASDPPLTSASEHSLRDATEFRCVFC